VRKLRSIVKRLEVLSGELKVVGIVDEAIEHGDAPVTRPTAVPGPGEKFRLKSLANRGS
jgi:hypothetical protein